MARTVSSSRRARAHLGADRQQRLAGLRHHRAAAGDGERVVAGLRQVGEQRAHVGGGLEPMLRRDAAAVLFRQQAALGDAEQRVVRLVHVGGRRSSSRWWRPAAAARVGQRDQAGFDRALRPAGRGGAVPRRCGRGTPRPAGAAAVRPRASGPRPAGGAIGPVVPPVSRSRPAACSAMRSNASCGFRPGRSRGSRCDDRRWRLARPVASCASSTTGSGGRRGLSARASAIWQPMIGWMPLPAQSWLNSSAPNRLPVSVIATAGMCGFARQGGDFVRLDRALAERVRSEVVQLRFDFEESSPGAVFVRSLEKPKCIVSLPGLLRTPPPQSGQTPATSDHY